MPFTVYEKIYNTSNFLNKEIAKASVSLAKYWTACPVVILNSKIMELLGWSKGNKVQISFGSGEDDGWVSVEKSETGYSLSATGGTKTASCKFVYPKMPKSVTVLSATPCKFNVLQGKLFFKIPLAALEPQQPNGDAS